jgi:hypothetical protein
LADALFTKTQQRVLGVLFGHPERSFYASELIRDAGTGSGAAQRELAKLERSGLIVALTDYPMDALDLDYNAALRRIPNPHNVTVQTFRTKAFDAALLDALRKGARQVIVLGAGFDSRGYRFQSQLRGVRFMEVDYGPTQDDKKERVSVPKKEVSPPTYRPNTSKYSNGGSGYFA